MEKSNRDSCSKAGKGPLMHKSYGPISLTSCLRQVLERLSENRLMFYLEVNNILSPSQWGFRRNRRTTDGLVHLKTWMSNAFVNRQYLVSTFLDLE